jgi:anthranilate phosphoribosyltransferase
VESAGCVRAVLAGESSPERSIVVLNAAAAIYVGGQADSLEAGARAAEEAIDSGKAREAMERFVARTRELAPA